MRKKNDARFFRKPHSLEARDGRLEATMKFRIADRLPDTSAAMSEIAKAECEDDTRRKTSGTNDYTNSFEKLTFAMEILMREYYSNYHGQKCVSPADSFILPVQESDLNLTLALMWQLRHICVHDIRIVKPGSKRKYESLLRKGRRAGRIPIADLPRELNLGEQVQIDYKSYREAFECLFSYVDHLGVDPEDIKILRSRASISMHRLTLNSCIEWQSEGLRILVRIDDLRSHGVDVSEDGSTVDMPECELRIKDHMIILLESGETIPCEILQNSSVELGIIKKKRKGS